MHKSKLSTFVIDCQTSDIESDDLEAEVRRLEVLGAKRIQFVKRWWVMETPTGHRFCVVNPQRGPIGADGNEWPDRD